VATNEVGDGPRGVAVGDHVEHRGIEASAELFEVLGGAGGVDRRGHLAEILLRNALQATPAGELRVHGSYVRRPADQVGGIGGHSTIAVVGAGPPADFATMPEGALVARGATAVAVEVECAVPSRNSRPHITLAVHTARGGRSRDANDLTEWEAVEPLTLRGVVLEVD